MGDHGLCPIGGCQNHRSGELVRAARPTGMHPEILSPVDFPKICSRVALGIHRISSERPFESPRGNLTGSPEHLHASASVKTCSWRPHKRAAIIVVLEILLA